MSDEQFLSVAFEEAQTGLNEGGVPVGAALFSADGSLLGRGHNRRVQNDDPSVHGETDAFRNAGRRRHYRDTVMVTTLAPCWYCSGLIRQFGIPKVLVGDTVNFYGGVDWLREAGVEIVNMNSQDCITMMATFIENHPELWYEDIGT